MNFLRAAINKNKAFITGGVDCLLDNVDGGGGNY